MKRKAKLFNNAGYVYLDNPMIKGWHKCQSNDEFAAWIDEVDDGSLDNAKLHWVGAPIGADVMQDILALIKEFKNREVMICLYYSRKDNKWLALCPEQIGRGASVKYKLDNAEVPAGYLFCGTVHSHPQMSAFWSGTDRNDQCSKDGIHIVVGTDSDGNLKTYLCSLWFHGVCYDAQDKVEIPSDLPKVREDWKKKVIEENIIEVPRTEHKAKSKSFNKHDNSVTAVGYKWEDADDDDLDETCYDDYELHYIFGDCTQRDKMNAVLWLLNDMGYEDLADFVEANLAVDMSDSEVHNEPNII